MMYELYELSWSLYYGVYSLVQYLDLNVSRSINVSEV
jgi:hypothetical protein